MKRPSKVPLCLLQKQLLKSKQTHRLRPCAWTYLYSAFSLSHEKRVHRCSDSKSPESVPDIYYKCQALSPMLFLSERLISWGEKVLFCLFVFQISGDFSPHWLVCGGYLYIMRYFGDKTPNLNSFMLHIYLIIAITSRQFHAIFSIMSDTKCHDVTLWFPVQIVGNFGAFWVFQVFDCSICILCHTFYTKFSG